MAKIESNLEEKNPHLGARGYWLIKSEPFKYSWNQFEKDKQTFWDGVRNYQARNNLKAMKKGDLLLWYHSNEGMEVVGIAKLVKEHYQDPTTDDTNWVVVDVKPVKKLKKPVTLAQVKADVRLEKMALVRLGRLSVQPVTSYEWNVIMELAEMPASDYAI
ncbi:MAG: EVE domain-containing protein [Flavobacterium sp.]|nr:EVE domain-containing protein [Flavobacterium sp.]